MKVSPDIFNGISSDYHGAVVLIGEFALGTAASDRVKSIVLQSFLDTNPEVVRNDFIACNHFDLMEAVGNISLPTLILTGSEDHLTPVKYGEYLNQNISGSKHVVIEGAGHMLALEKPKEFMFQLTTFIEYMDQRKQG